jgi:uncharacterized protein YcfJ
MKTKSLIISFATIASLGTASAQADYRNGFPDKARVISSTPVYDHVNEPRKECWTETVGYEERVSRGNNGGGSIIGAIAGGLLGSTVGKGNGRIAAAAVGAATGAVIGDRMDNDDRYYRSSRPRQVERCRVTDNFHDVVVGYDVAYKYRGQEYAARLPYDPGQWLDVNVAVAVAERQTPYSRNDSYHDDWR